MARGKRENNRLQTVQKANAYNGNVNDRWPRQLWRH